MLLKIRLHYKGCFIYSMPVVRRAYFDEDEDTP